MSMPKTNLYRSVRILNLSVCLSLDSFAMILVS